MRFAESGAGIIWFEATAVCKEGRANPRQLYLTEENVDTYKILLDNIRKVSIENFGYAPLIILQATHSGRYSKPNGTPEPIIAYRNKVYEKARKICFITLLPMKNATLCRKNLRIPLYLLKKQALTAWISNAVTDICSMSF